MVDGPMIRNEAARGIETLDGLVQQPFGRRSGVPPEMQAHRPALSMQSCDGFDDGPLVLVVVDRRHVNQGQRIFGRSRRHGSYRPRTEAKSIAHAVRDPG